MFTSFHDLGHGAELSADVCIIGAGAAGITLALELARTGRDVLLLESGDREFDPDIQDLNRGEADGGDFLPLDHSRLRFFGGTTNHWTGHCRPLDVIDFEARDWVPDSGWPIARADLDPYYRRAMEICQIGPIDDEVPLPADLDSGLVPFDETKVVNRPWRTSPPTRFGEVYGDDLARAGNVRVLLRANVVELVQDETGAAIERVRIRSITGREGSVRARDVVVACGGIENPRLLLASDGTEPAGIGNRHGLVGRYFQVHPHALVGFAVALVPLERFAPYADVVARPALTPAVQRRHGILNSAIAIGWGYDRSPGFEALRDIGRAVRARRWPDRLGARLLQVLEDLDGAIAGGYRHLRNREVLWFAANSE